MSTSEPIRELLRGRRSAHRFLVGPAPAWFALQEHSSGPMFMPPSLPAAAGTEPNERLEALAADEAMRLGHAELFTFDPGATAAAVSYGARLQGIAATADAVPGATIAGHGIVPPVPSGFLRWAMPITRPGAQAPIIGVHWGRITTPETSGVWLVLWGDLSAVLMHGLADTSAPTWFTPQLAHEVLAQHGPLFYNAASFLQDPDAPRASHAADSRPAAFPFTHLRALPPATLPAEQLDPDDTLTYIVLASWALLTPDPAQPTPPPHLTRHTIPAPQAEADRRAGLPPARQITLVTAPVLQATDPLPAGVDDDIHHLRMRICALVTPDAPEGPTPDDVIADLLRRYEAEVVIMAACQSGQRLLHALADGTRTSRRTALTQILSSLSPAEQMPFDGQAWTALRRLLLAPHPEPALPPTGIAPADLLWALGTFQACALMRLTGNEHRGDRSNHKTATRPPNVKPTRKRKKRR